jgi:hypothetical protein
MVVIDWNTSNISTKWFRALFSSSCLTADALVSRARFIAYGAKFASAPSLLSTIKQRLVTSCSGFSRQ